VEERGIGRCIPERNAELAHTVAPVAFGKAQREDALGLSLEHLQAPRLDKVVLLLDLLDVRQPARRSQELQTRTAPTQKRAFTHNDG
jgi:hypothetical protein